MTSPSFRPSKIAAAVAAMCALCAGPAFGAAFALQENSGSGLGNAFAGGAAAAEDASAMWANAASMSKRGSMEAAAALHLITPSIKFRNGASLPATSQPLGGEGGDAGGLNVVPNTYFVVPINRQWTFGFGLNAPFGLVTEYDDNWLGRYQAIKSEVKTINVNPAISFKPTDNFAIGFGVNWQRIDAEFTNKVNYSGALLQAAIAAGIAPGSATFNAIAAATPGLDSFAKVEGDDSAWGWNVGILWDLSKNTRIGLGYRSEIEYTVSADAQFSNPTVVGPAPLQPTLDLLSAGVNSQRLFNSGITSEITLPQIFNASIFHQLNDRWDIMADVQWTGWSSIKELKFTRTTSTATCPAPCVLQNTPQNFDDAWRVSVGANYRHSDRWMFRGGIAFDQTPVNGLDRTPRLPDEDRWWFSFGAQYKYSPKLKLDAGFTYIRADKAAINQNAGSTPSFGLINGSYDADVTIFSMQGTYTF